ncbi:phage head closure protein [Massilia oculi]|uniref:Phage head closure protein n=1 Tax=Massilia hydrophila TaxID=3044279 RepID=A0ABS7YET0_9BURK|nr:phage head closure protein [Massilia oculi]MCA1857451.1 phage head closure protein [Massilia oculi]
MNEKITLQTPPAGRDAIGQIVGGWESVTPDVWADVRFQTGAEVLRGGLPVSTVRISVMVRARSDIDNTMRIVHKGIGYDIKAVLPNAKDRRFMFLVCEAAK